MLHSICYTYVKVYDMYDIYVYLYVYICTHIYTHIYIHTHVYIGIGGQALSSSPRVDATATGRKAAPSPWATV